MVFFNVFTVSVSEWFINDNGFVFAVLVMHLR